MYLTLKINENSYLTIPKKGVEALSINEKDGKGVVAIAYANGCGERTMVFDKGGIEAAKRVYGAILDAISEKSINFNDEIEIYPPSAPGQIAHEGPTTFKPRVLKNK